VANSLICPFTKHLPCQQPATGGRGWPARPDPAIFKKSLSLCRWRFFYIIFSQGTPVLPAARRKQPRRGGPAGRGPLGTCDGDRGLASEGTCWFPGRGRDCSGGSMGCRESQGGSGPCPCPQGSHCSPSTPSLGTERAGPEGTSNRR